MASKPLMPKQVIKSAGNAGLKPTMTPVKEIGSAKKNIVAVPAAPVQVAIPVTPEVGYDEDFEAYEDESFDSLDEEEETQSTSVDKPEAVKVAEKTYTSIVQAVAEPKVILDPYPAIKLGKNSKIKSLKRFKDISHLLDISYSPTYTLFNLSPCSEYDLYIRNFGMLDASQKPTQTGSETNDQQIQTELIKMENKSIFADYGEHLSGPVKERRGKKKDELSDALDFLKQATDAMIRLMDESQYSRADVYAGNIISEFSESIESFNLPETIFKGRTVIKFTSQIYHPQFVFILWSAGAESSSVKGMTNIHRKHLISLYKLPETKSPFRIFVCEEEPLSLTMEFYRRELFVFAGLADGTVVAWSLTRGKSVLSEWPVEDTPIRTKVAFVCPIVDCVGSFVPSAHESSDWIVHVSAMKEQELLVSVDRVGNIRHENMHSFLNAEGVSSLSPTHSLLTKSARAHIEFAMTCCTYCLYDETLLIASENGYIYHWDIAHRRKSKSYRLNSSERSIYPTNLAVSPFLPLFAAAFSDGSIALFDIECVYPVKTWTPHNVKIRDIKWSMHRPAVFYVLLGDGKMEIWDLLSSPTGPYKTLNEFTIKQFCLSVQGFMIFSEFKQGQFLVSLALLTAELTSRIESESQLLLQLFQIDH